MIKKLLILAGYDIYIYISVLELGFNNKDTRDLTKRHAA